MRDHRRSRPAGLGFGTLHRGSPVRSGLLLCIAVSAAACTVVHELSNVEPINFTGASVTGTVTDSVSQAPLIGAEVVLLTSAGDSIPDQPTKAFSYPPDGTYRFGDVRPGSYLLQVHFDGYEPVTVPLQGLEAGERRVIPFRLQPR